MRIPGQHPTIPLRVKRHGAVRIAHLFHLPHVGTVAYGLERDSAGVTLAAPPR
jgi:hypothetical protein